MNEQIVVGHSRARRRMTKRARCERRDGYIAVIAMILMFVGMEVFFLAAFLPHKAYGATLYPEETFQMSEQEYTDLSHLLCGEAGLEPYEGQMAVVEVIANRVRDDGYPSSFHEVMRQHGQFGAWAARNDKKVMQAQIDAIEEVRTSEKSVFEKYIKEEQAKGRFLNVRPEDYVFFGNDDDYRRVGYRYMRNLIRIGNHLFATR